MILLTQQKMVKAVDEFKDTRRDEGVNRNGADPKRAEIITDQLMMEKVLVVIKIFWDDIFEERILN